MGGDPPRTKTIFIRVHRTKICKGQVGDKSPPQGGELEKVPYPQKFKRDFLKLQSADFFNFRDQRGLPLLRFKSKKFRANDAGEVPQKKIKKIHFGEPGPQI